jgi:hypothetical protein
MRGVGINATVEDQALTYRTDIRFCKSEAVESGLGGIPVAADDEDGVRIPIIRHGLVASLVLLDLLQVAKDDHHSLVPATVRSARYHTDSV